jgi:hypothetical protein
MKTKAGSGELTAKRAKNNRNICRKDAKAQRSVNRIFLDLFIYELRDFAPWRENFGIQNIR